MIELECYYLVCSLCHTIGKRHTLSEDYEIAIENAREEYLAYGWRSQKGQAVCPKCVKEINTKKPSIPRALDFDSDI